MKVKANKSFVGLICMAKGEIRDITDKTLLADLLKCKFIEKVETEKKPTRK